MGVVGMRTKSVNAVIAGRASTAQCIIPYEVVYVVPREISC